MSTEVNAPSNPSQCRSAKFMHISTPIFRLEVTRFAGCSRVAVLDFPENRYTPKNDEPLRERESALGKKISEICVDCPLGQVIDMPEPPEKITWKGIGK
ncbi:MAG: hypothetical protein H6799_03210 [Candidatus Nomurabacteria bacterium]|nr:MAG: hypothetical protein H6799_03210 [Candidatus Nomurabacteria bacterium]HRV75799.1 hypothetical protein [Candidatus Saccharimonadales bacterium]